MKTRKNRLEESMFHDVAWKEEEVRWCLSSTPQSIEYKEERENAKTPRPIPAKIVKRGVISTPLYPWTKGGKKGGGNTEETV